MGLVSLLESVEKGIHSACSGCPSNPKAISEVAFGVSCRKHGVDWSLPQVSAVSMMIVRDPANTTPEITGKLCFVCNSANATDGTAQHAFALWRAAVSLADRGEAAYRYLNQHYWTNAAMHGTDESRLRQARRCCVAVLNEQMEELAPRVVIASGTEAATSLYDLGLVSRPWSIYRSELASGEYSEVTPCGTRVFCTYHTSKRAVNFTVEKLYSPLTERLLDQKRSKLMNPAAMDAFLTRYRGNDREGKGMRVLLLHWLDIGEAIREAHRQA